MAKYTVSVFDAAFLSSLSMLSFFGALEYSV